jgi:hypothetical protein
MAGKYRWCMIFLRVLIHKWGIESGLSQDPWTVSGSGVP